MTKEPIKIKIDVADKTQELVDIRERLGLPKADVVLPRSNIEIDKIINSEEIKSLLGHPHRLIIDPETGDPLFLYIRDHTVRRNKGISPEEMNRVHFTECSTLMHMDNIGRFGRYCKTSRTDDLYYVEFSGGEEILCRLYPCKNCLELAGYDCYDIADWQKRNQIVSEFKAKEAMDKLWQTLDTFKKSMQERNLRQATSPVGYARNWRDISKYFRARRKFTCERCKVNLSASKFLRGLTDAHHKDGDKRNNHNDNLECLCKLCHAEEHPHYPVKDKHRYAIEQARKGIFVRRSDLFAGWD